MERILQRWYDMISIRSVNGHEAQMADYVANVLRELGMDPHYSYFEEDTARERPSVWSVLDSGRPGKTVLLIGHIDTVGVSDRWKTDPFTPTEIDGKVYLFFDEIQEVKDWEKCINSFRVSLDCDIYITGSNAKLLSGELATYLGGRYVEFVIYPFSFGEFMELYRSISPDASIQQCFQKYLLAGGMPYLANLRYADAPSKQYLHDLFNSVQLKDIVKRNKIRDVDLLERIIAYVIANVGTTVSATSLAKFLKNEQRTVAPETILNYIKYCCEAYLFYQVKREDLQGKQILASNEKYYIADHGIREAVFGGNMRDINLILENIVYLELLRRGYEVTVGRTGDKEIDFVCDKRGEKLYVQVTYLLASEETVNREFGAYDSIRDNFPKYVVSLDEFDMSRNGIKHRNIRDFLLAEEWN